MSTQPLHILAIGRNAEIMTVMHRLLNAPEHWSGTTVTTDESAREAFEKEAFDIVLICAGVTPEEEATLQAHFEKQRPDVLIKRHYGGGSGLLVNEIRYALDNKQR
jgi:hypothetical protein